MNDLELMLEIFEWRDVVGYEGLYKVSEYGDVLSVKSNELLKPQNDCRGYLQVGLYKNRKRKQYKIHRLVATAFCEGAEYFNEVNHIDEDKTNNHYSNLEWCTREYNNNFGTRNDRIGESSMKKVRCIELDRIFNSVKEASEYINRNKENISACLRGKRKTCGNFHWEYVK